MINFIIRRVLISVVTICVIAVFSWIIIQLPPGDYVSDYVEELRHSQGINLTPEMEANLRTYYGLDQPQYMQFLKWVTRMFHGDFGYVMGNQGGGGGAQYRVGPLIWSRLPGTIGITFATLVFTWSTALPIGIYSGMRQRSVGDYFWTFVGFAGLAVPDFLLALALIWIWFTQTGDVLGGFFSEKYQFAPWSVLKMWDLLKHTWIAAVVIGTAGTAGLIRVMRNNLLDELHKPYVVTARSKGLGYWKTVMKYPFRLAFLPFASSMGSIFASLVSGSIIVSIVMDLRTVGPVLYRAVIQEDMFLAATILLLLSVLIVFGVLVSDLVLAWVDPRIRMEEGIEA